MNQHQHSGYKNQYDRNQKHYRHNNDGSGEMHHRRSQGGYYQSMNQKHHNQYG